MLPMMGGLIFVAFIVTALAVEISLLGVAFRDVSTVADLAAESGAATLLQSGAYDTHLLLDERGAEVEALRVASLWGSGDESATVRVRPDSICVTVSDTYRPRTLVFIGVNELTVNATGCAIPAAG
ncbi:MAG: hypothetical protein ABFR95_03260 [Actinomycetota bacterium]